MIDNGKNLIFIFSQPRSGSTLLQRILSNHSQITSKGETWFLLPFLVGFEHKWYRRRSKETINSQKNINIFLNSMNYGKKSMLNSVGLGFDKAYEHFLTENNNKYFLEKTPRYTYYIDEIGLMFPRAKFIFLIRDNSEVLKSIYIKWAKYKIFRLFSYLDDLIIVPKLLQKSLESTHNEKIVITYDELVDETDNTLKRICKFLEIDYEENMQNYGFKNNQPWSFGDDEIYQHQSPTRDTKIKKIDNFSMYPILNYIYKYILKLK